MKVKEILCRMSGDALVTIINHRDEIVIDCDTTDRISAFGDVDKEVHSILRSDVIKIKVGEVHHDLILFLAKYDADNGRITR